MKLVRSKLTAPLNDDPRAAQLKLVLHGTPEQLTLLLVSLANGLTPAFHDAQGNTVLHSKQVSDLASPLEAPVAQPPAAPPVVVPAPVEATPAPAPVSPTVAPTASEQALTGAAPHKRSRKPKAEPELETAPAAAPEPTPAPAAPSAQPEELLVDRTPIPDLGDVEVRCFKKGAVYTAAMYRGDARISDVLTGTKPSLVTADCVAMYRASVSQAAPAPAAPPPAPAAPPPAPVSAPAEVPVVTAAPRAQATPTPQASGDYVVDGWWKEKGVPAEFLNNMPAGMMKTTATGKPVQSLREVFVELKAAFPNITQREARAWIEYRAASDAAAIKNGKPADQLATRCLQEIAGLAERAERGAKILLAQQPVA